LTLVEVNQNLAEELESLRRIQAESILRAKADCRPELTVTKRLFASAQEELFKARDLNADLLVQNETMRMELLHMQNAMSTAHEQLLHLMSERSVVKEGIAAVEVEVDRMREADALKLRKIAQAQEEAAQARCEAAQAQESLGTLKKRVGERLKENSAQLADREQALTAAQQELTGCRADCDTMREMYLVEMAAVKSAKASHLQAETNLAATQATLTEVQASLVKVQASLVKVQAEFAEFRATAHAAKVKAKKARSAEVKLVRQQGEDSLLKSKEDAAHTIATLNAQLATEVHTVTTLRAELAAAAPLVEELRAEVAVATPLVNELRAYLSNSENHAEKLRETAILDAKNIAEMQGVLNQERATVERLTSQLRIAEAHIATTIERMRVEDAERNALTQNNEALRAHIQGVDASLRNLLGANSAVLGGQQAAPAHACLGDVNTAEKEFALNPLGGAEEFNPPGGPAFN
jgi:hypothetical protein